MQGLGTETLPCRVTSWAQLDSMRQRLDLSYALMNDLSASSAGGATYASSTANGGLGWDPVSDSTNYFIGQFDGQGFTIADLNINRPAESYIGLFGFVGSAGKVRNIGLIDPDIVGGGYTGGISGEVMGAWAAEALVENSFVRGGTIVGGGSTGGITGYTGYRSRTQNVYSETAITGGWGTGGISGSHWGGEILYSYGNSTIGGSGGGRGGVIGQGSSPITDTYWNTDLFAISAGGVGKTDAELQTLSTFSTWDIVDWSAHADEIWKIDDGNDYPRLGWE
jgi:hypothetical protein